MGSRGLNLSMKTYVTFTADAALTIKRKGPALVPAGAGLVSGELLEDPPPVIDPEQSRLVRTRTREGNNLRLGWQIEPLTAEELAAIAAAKARQDRKTKAFTDLASALAADFGITLTGPEDLEGKADMIFTIAQPEIEAADTLPKLKAAYKKHVTALFRLVVLMFRSR